MSNPRTTGSLEERHKWKRKKKETQFRKLATCLTRAQGANPSQGPRGAITQETEGVSGLEIDFFLEAANK